MQIDCAKGNVVSGNQVVNDIRSLFDADSDLDADSDSDSSEHDLQAAIFSSMGRDAAAASPAKKQNINNDPKWGFEISYANGIDKPSAIITDTKGRLHIILLQFNPQRNTWAQGKIEEHLFLVICGSNGQFELRFPKPPNEPPLFAFANSNRPSGAKPALVTSRSSTRSQDEERSYTPRP
jgi:hypothetical protein